MAILPLEYYRRRVLTSMDDKFRYSTTKGPKLIIPGTLFGCRLSQRRRIQYELYSKR